MTRRWVAALDELEAWIDRALRVDDGSDAPAPWAAADDLGPLPPELATRATAVLARVTVAEQELAARREVTRAEIEGRRARHRLARPSSAPTASLVDRIA